MISEKYKGHISIVCIGLSILFILCIMLQAPKIEKAAETSSSKEYVLNKDKITEINIEIKDSDWKWLLENATKEEFRSANITIDGETFYNVGLRPKGNSSLSSVANDPNTDRFSLKIDFSQFIKGQTYHGFEKLALNNMMSDATYMKEYLSYNLYDFLEVPVPEYSYSNIKINGKNWGLYLAVEVIEENFIQKKLGNLQGNLYKPESAEIGGGMAKGGNGFQGFVPQQFPQEAAKQASDNIINKAPNQNMPFANNSGGGANLKYIDDKPSSYSVVKAGTILKTTTDKDFEKVIAMIKNLNDGTNLEEYLDVEEILKYFAVNTFLVNLDSYSGGMYHNYYLYEKDGKFKIIPWDLNMSFGGFSMTMGAGENGAQKVINFPIDSPVTGNLENAPLIGNLLKVDKYRNLYHNYLRKIAEEYVNVGALEASTANIDKLIDEYVKSDATAFYKYDEYKKSIPELITFGRDRAISVVSQLSGKQPSTSYGNIETKLNLSSLGSMQMIGQKLGPGDQIPSQGGNRPAGGGQNPGMGGEMLGMKNMPPQENMMAIMNILMGSDITKLTAEQKEKLKALGVDDEMLNTFKNFAPGGMGMGKAGMPPMAIGTTGSGNPISFLIQVIAIVLILISGLVFAFKFRRRSHVKNF